MATRVDRMFPEADINDLLKSMVLEDFSANAANQPGKLTGTIVGVEKQRVPAGA